MEELITHDFLDYIKKVEGTKNEFWGIHYPYKSAEGGSDTIGYGHKLKSGESFEKGLSQSTVEELLRKDLDAAASRAKDSVGEAWDSLDNNRKRMLIDFQFNLGSLRKFPKFKGFLIANDYEGMVAEYERSYTDEHGVHRKLEQRNREFFKEFLDTREIILDGRKTNVVLITDREIITWQVTIRNR